MIVPNLMVADMARSIDFYRDVPGMTLTMGVTADRGMVTDPDGHIVCLGTPEGPPPA